MKRNFLVTTSLTDTWEFKENNFLLGRWCEFYEFSDSEIQSSREKLINEMPKKDNIIKNIDHWEDHEKKIKDYEYLEKKIDYLLEIISEKLSEIHNVNENKEYWRIVVYNWLNQYTSTIFDKWETVRIFFEKNKTKKFYSNFILFNDLDYIPKNHPNFGYNTQRDEWNHLIFLRIFNFLNIQNLSLIKKEVKNIITKRKSVHSFYSMNTANFTDLQKSTSLTNRIINLIDNMISKFAFRFNKIIIESFYFPKKEYLKICIRCNLIPSKYLNFFNFDIKENNLLENNKRIVFKNLLSKIDTQDKFIRFLLLNLHKDIPKSYLENFDAIKKKILPLAKRKKIIFSMHSLFTNDNFKIYIAETKKVGSKYIHSDHGAGLTFKINPFADFFEKVSYKIVKWNNVDKKQNVIANLSPTLPVIKLKNKKRGDNCSVIFAEQRKYRLQYDTRISLNQSIDFFNELTQFVNSLNPEIKSKIKFRSKGNFSYNSEKKFLEMFSEKNIDRITFKNSFTKTILNSKLIINTYPETAFCEAMYANIPTVLLMKKNHYKFTKTALNTLNDLINNKIAFEDFNEAKIHINKYWKELDSWWKRENVQSARKKFLKNFFDVKLDWCKEWSDYIYFL